MPKIIVGNFVCQYPSQVLIVGFRKKAGRYLKLAAARAGSIDGWVVDNADSYVT